MLRLTALGHHRFRKQPLGVVGHNLVDLGKPTWDSKYNNGPPPHRVTFRAAHQLRDPEHHGWCLRRQDLRPLAGPRGAGPGDSCEFFELVACRRRVAEDYEVSAHPRSTFSGGTTPQTSRRPSPCPRSPSRDDFKIMRIPTPPGAAAASAEAVRQKTNESRELGNTMGQVWRGVGLGCRWREGGEWRGGTMPDPQYSDLSSQTSSADHCSCHWAAACVLLDDIAPRDLPKHGVKLGSEYHTHSTAIKGCCNK